MKIGIVVENFHSNRRYLEHYLAAELVLQNHMVHVFSFSNSKEIQVKKSTKGLIVHKIPFLFSLSGYHIPSYKAIRYLLKVLREVKLDVVHCQPLFSPLAIIFSLVRSFFHYEIVGSLISGLYSIKSNLDNLKYIVVKLIVERYVIRVTTRIFAKSIGIRKILQGLFKISPEKIQIIPLGADPDIFSFDHNARRKIRKELGYTEQDTVILCSGRLYAGKQIEGLFIAAAPIIKDDEHVKIFVIGGGTESYMELLKTLCRKLGIIDNVKFHPWVEHIELAEYFSVCDISVWPGGASISMIEAAACSLPLISRKVPMEEYVLRKGNSFVYKSGDLEQLSHYLKLLIMDKALRKEMGENSRKLVEDHLNWKTIVNSYIVTYRNISKNASQR